MCPSSNIWVVSYLLFIIYPVIGAKYQLSIQLPSVSFWSPCAGTEVFCSKKSFQVDCNCFKSNVSTKHVLESSLEAWDSTSKQYVYRIDRSSIKLYPCTVASVVIQMIVLYKMLQHLMISHINFKNIIYFMILVLKKKKRKVWCGQKLSPFNSTFYARNYINPPYKQFQTSTLLHPHIPDQGPTLH